MSVLTITTFQPQINWPYGGSTATLRIKYSANFTSSTGQPVLRGLFKDVPCTIAGGVLTVPDLTLITTNDALVNPLVTCSAQFFDSTGAGRDWLFQNFSIPQSLTPSASIGSLFTYNQGAALVLPPSFYLNREQVVALVTTMLSALGFGPATDLVPGMVKLSIAANDPLNPAVWGTNDPRVRDALKLMGVELDSTLASPADTNVIGFDATLGRFIAQATAIPALHAASHQNSGLDEIVVTGLSGLLADPQIPLLHAVLHELGGPDQINVGGLSGLLADAQTALAHALSHQFGGADVINVADLSGLLADAQNPLAHKTTHQEGGSDAIKIDDLAAADDNTDLNASTGTHGLLPKLDNDANNFLNGQGNWAIPPGAGGAATQIIETGGPTTLDIAAIADGEFLKRVGTDIVSAAVSGGSTDVLEVQVFS